MPESIQDILPLVKQYAGANGTCSDAQGISYLNAAQLLLWNKSDFQQTTMWMKVCCVNNCVTLPSIVKQVRLAWLCGVPMSLGNQWFESIPQVGQLNPKLSCWNKFIQEGNSFCTFQEYNLGPYNVMLMAENPADTGVNITVHVVDQYGTQKQDTIMLAAPPDTSTGTVMAKAVIGVVKPKTRGRVRLYAYDPTTSQNMLLAVYQPYDINPTFLRYKNMACNSPLTIFAKRKYIPVEAPTDFLSFPIDALIHAIQAVVYRQNRDNANFLTSLSLAVQEVNRETADLEAPAGSPLRLFSPQRVTALNPMYAWGDDGDGGWGIGYGGIY